MGSDIKLLVLSPLDCSQSRLPVRGAILGGGGEYVGHQGFLLPK